MEQLLALQVLLGHLGARGEIPHAVAQVLEVLVQRLGGAEDLGQELNSLVPDASGHGLDAAPDLLEELTDALEDHLRSGAQAGVGLAERLQTGTIFWPISL